jgi:rRNA maturation endonuclease Nob1
MATCMSCRKEVSDEAEECPHCGASMTEPTIQDKPHCGTIQIKEPK